jgi:uncharacterized protein
MTRPLTETLTALCDEHALTALYVFGSRAAEIAAGVAGKAASVEHPGSDVDIGVLPSRTGHLSAKVRVRLAQQLETLLRVDRVDLVVLPEAEAFLAADVVRGELLAATDLDAEAEAQLYYLRRAADLAPFLREQWRDRVGSEL